MKYNHLTICDICGFQYHAYEMRKNWKNQIVCPTDYEPKQPQLTIKPRTDRQSVNDAREPTDPGLADPPFTTSDMI